MIWRAKEVGALLRSYARMDTRFCAWRPWHSIVIHSKGKQVVRPDPLSKEAKRMIGQISTLRNLIGALFVGCLNNHGMDLETSGMTSESFIT